jgi:hypothetical protein
MPDKNGGNQAPAPALVAINALTRDIEAQHLGNKGDEARKGSVEASGAYHIFTGHEHARHANAFSIWALGEQKHLGGSGRQMAAHTVALREHRSLMRKRREDQKGWTEAWAVGVRVAGIVIVIGNTSAVSGPRYTPLPPLSPPLG